MGFLDGFFPEYPNELQYDANGFLIANNSGQIIPLINNYTGNQDDGYRSDNDDNDDNDDNYQTFVSHEEVSISIGMTSFNVSDTNLSYTYHIHLSFDDGYGHYIAHGNVIITCIKDEQNNRYISDINVNGTHNGALHDRYNDCFDIYPYEYLHILCPNIPYNIP